MKCRFCGYKHGWIWDNKTLAYEDHVGVHDEFYHFRALRYGREVSMMVCPNPECQRTQIEE